MSPSCALAAIYTYISSDFATEIGDLKKLIAMKDKNWSSIADMFSNLCWKLSSLPSDNQIMLLQQMQATALEVLEIENCISTSTITIAITKVIPEIVHFALTSSQRDVRNAALEVLKSGMKPGLTFRWRSVCGEIGSAFAKYHTRCL
jgi:hypothetical protein